MDALGSLLAAAFRLLARLRGGRALHPVGLGYRARLEVGPGARRFPGTRLLVPGAGYRALVRFSRGAGLPERLPDALGVAVRLVDAYGPGQPQDLLLTSSADLPVARRLLFPARSFLHRSFSSALPYRVGGRRVVALLAPRPAPAGAAWPRTGRALADLAAAAATGALAYELRLAGSLGRARTVGVLAIGTPLDAAATEGLRFNPWTTGQGIHPLGRLNRLRRPSYRASQQGHPWSSSTGSPAGGPAAREGGFGGRRPVSRRPGSAAAADGERMDGWILAHGSGIDDLVVFAAAAALVLAVRWGTGRRRAPEDPEEPTND